MRYLVIYAYDAYCGWCYGFGSVIRKLYNEYSQQLDFDVYSGGMIRPEQPVHISTTASHMREEYKRVEELTDAKFGADYLWHITNEDKTDWYPDSLKPAIALVIFKEYYPDQQVLFATDLEYALFAEGRDLCDDEAYLHMLEKWQISADEFYSKLHSAEYQEKAEYEFAILKQLSITGFPTLLLQVSDSKFYLLSRGYADYDTVNKRLQSVLAEVAGISNA